MSTPGRIARCSIACRNWLSDLASTVPPGCSVQRRRLLSFARESYQPPAPDKDLMTLTEAVDRAKEASLAKNQGMINLYINPQIQHLPPKVAEPPKLDFSAISYRSICEPLRAPVSTAQSSHGAAG